MAPLSGLHAKLYVADAGWNARVWTGSANATNAAFERNVEFLVELHGKKSHCGIESLLSQSAVETNFVDLLQDYTLREDGNGPDAEMERLTALADGVRRQLATAGLMAEVNPLPGEIERFEIRLRFREGSSLVSLSEEVSVRCWPITLPASAVSFEVNAEGSIVFGPLSFDALTSFFAFELVASSGNKEIASRFVLNARLEGAPSDRRERIMRSLLDSQDKVLRLILFLLAEGGHDSHEALLATRRMVSGGTGNGAVRTDFPLFESLVRALERDPARLDQIARLLDDLRKSPEGQRLVPQGLEAIWEPIISVRGRLEA